MEKPNKQRFTMLLSGDLLERARNIVYWTPGITMVSLAEEGLKMVLERFEKERGSSFPHRREELKSGRPII